MKKIVTVTESMCLTLLFLASNDKDGLIENVANFFMTFSALRRRGLVDQDHKLTRAGVLVFNLLLETDVFHGIDIKKNMAVTNDYC